MVNADYDKLFMENIILSSQKGFQYINSIDCYNLLEKLHLIEEEVLKKTNDNNLINDYNSWKNITNNRDNEMIKNIYEYSKKHSYNKAVFIIGAEHKKSIFEKINEFDSKENIKINWRSWRIA
jgi:succinate dehydrogenase flavin-adding protein (antitoxin of CptAB toxin-antitoxin module)